MARARRPGSRGGRTGGMYLVHEAPPDGVVPGWDEPGGLHRLSPDLDVIEVAYLRGGWVAFRHDGFPGHRVSVLADTSDPTQPRLIGLRVEPFTDDKGDPLPNTPTLDSAALRSLTAGRLAKVARDALGIDKSALPASLADLVGKGRKPRAGTPAAEQHRQAVAAVHQQAVERGETPALAIMRAFGVSRPSAYEWIKAYGLDKEER